jgi:hypothetical protein
MRNVEAVRAAMARLKASGIDVWLFGGWAEELLGLAESRAHKDLDLLFPAENFALLDAFMRNEGVREIMVKRSGCSRAFVAEGHFVEFYLVGKDGQGWYTDFWGYVHRWPTDTFSDESDFPKASEASLVGLRSLFPNVERAYNAHAERSQQSAS